MKTLPLRALGWPQIKPIPLVVAALIAAVLPLILNSSYWVDVCTLALIWMVLNQSWNLVLGYSGIWNFGQLAIYAIGGYAAAPTVLAATHLRSLATTSSVSCG